jgi:hypothetical protein
VAADRDVGEDSSWAVGETVVLVIVRCRAHGLVGHEAKGREMLHTLGCPSAEAGDLVQTLCSSIPDLGLAALSAQARRSLGGRFLRS